LHEFENAEEVYKSKEKMEDCDLVCYLYDNHDPKSFQYVANVQKELSDINLPSVFYATKSDLTLVKQTYSISPQEFCVSASTVPPKPISLLKGVEPELYSGLFQHIYEHSQSRTSSRKWPVIIGIGVIAIIAGAVIYWKYKR